MTLEATYLREPTTVKWTAAATFSAGQVVQLPDGRAGVIAGLKGFVSGDEAAAYVEGVFTLAKTTSMIVLAGQPLYWDATNNKAKYTGDYYLGVALEDATAAATTCVVDLNVKPEATIDLAKGQWTHGATNGLGVTRLSADEHKLAFDAVDEGAMAALYSAKTIAVARGFIFDAWVAIYDIGDHAALDINFGLANGTHATDADSITESCFFHLDGSALSINCESDDGTTEVAATDSTVDAVDDTYAYFQIDARTLTDIQMYINGVNVLPDSVFKLDAATGPLLAIVHLEKDSGTTNDTTADVRVKEMRVWNDLLA